MSGQNTFLFNPAYTGGLAFTLTQPLLRNFGIDINKTFISIAQNNAKVEEHVFFDRVLTVIASVEQSFWELVFVNENLKVAQLALKAAEESLEIARSRAQAGVVSDLDVYQADANRAQLASQVTELRRQRQATLHQLGVLTGVLDLELQQGDLRQLPSPPLPPAGLPSTLLERRPDIREAEATYASANAQIGVARGAQALEVGGAAHPDERGISRRSAIWSGSTTRPPHR